MSNSVFQSVMLQLKDASDRVFGVIDTEGCVVSCTDTSFLGERWPEAILKINGKYIACSFNTKPHGDQTIYDNGYNGQFCLHMVNSKTHGSDKVNEEHQHSIKRAYEWAH